jgi:hypothetical protein
VLERIALHQTRLCTPGLGLESKGVALGAKGVVLLPTIDRLVALLAIYTREHSLEDLLPSLAMHVVQSKLGTREITLEIAAESSDRMDRIADAARLVGGFTFTGSNRHFVQYRDGAAPFGYDANELVATRAGLVLYHDRFTQEYDVQRDVDLRSLLLRLHLHPEPASRSAPGARVIVAEQGLGGALVHYLVRSRVEGEVAACEWPPASSFEDAPVRRTLVRVAELPARMIPLFSETPGLTTFVPVAPGVAIEAGHRHAIELRACPVFDPNGLVLLRGGGREPWVLERMPVLGDLRAFARVVLRAVDDGQPLAAVAQRMDAPPVVRVPLRVLPTLAPWRRVIASWIRPEELALLRRIAYALPRSVLRSIEVAHTQVGAFLRANTGIESVPIGTFFTELHPSLLVAAGFDVVPQVAPDVLVRALSIPNDMLVFLDGSGRAVGVPSSAFSALETTLIEAAGFEPLPAEAVTRALELEPIDLVIEPQGPLPLRGAKPAPALDRPTAARRDDRAERDEAEGRTS